MSATYNITTHPLLSDKAKALLASSSAVFDAVAEASERNLRLHGTSFTGSSEEDAKLAIVYQLNFELEKTAESDIFESIERKDRVWKYKDGIPDINATAKRLADRLLATLTPNSSRSSSSISVSNVHSW